MKPVVRRSLPFARLAKGVVELAAVTGAFVLAYLLRFDFDPSPEDWTRFQVALPIAIAAKAFALWHLGLFGNWWWRYVGIPDVVRIGKAVTLASLASAALMLSLTGGFPRSVIGIDWALSFLFLLGVTAASRVLRESGMVGDRQPGRPVLIVGAGEAGVRLVNELRGNAQLRLRPLGFVVVVVRNVAGAIFNEIVPPSHCSVMIIHSGDKGSVSGRSGFISGQVAHNHCGGITTTCHRDSQTMSG